MAAALKPLAPQELDRKTARRRNLWSTLMGTARGVHWIQLVAWMIFLPVFGAVCVWNRMDSGAAVMGLLGLFATWRLVKAFDAAGKMKSWQRALLGFSAPIHLGFAFIGLFRLLGPVPGAWERVEGSADWTDPVLIRLDSGTVVAITSGEDKDSWWLAPGAETWRARGLPGHHGWHLAEDQQRAWLWVGPGRGSVVNMLDLATGKWKALVKPEGNVRGLAVAGDRVVLALSSGLYWTDDHEADWQLVPASGFCSGLGASADGEHLLAVGAAWSASGDGGRSWQEITRPIDAPSHPDAAIGPGPYRYVFQGGLFGGSFFVSEPDAAFVPRDLPARDARSLVVNPAKGREIVIGSWGKGVWYSESAGRHWRDLGLQGVEVRSLAVDFSARRVWAGSANLMFKRGVYARSF